MVAFEKISDIKRILRAGADKVSINTAAINRPEFIKEAAEHFGASTIVVSMEVIRQSDGSYFLFTDNGREYTGIDVKKVGGESSITRSWRNIFDLC